MNIDKFKSNTGHFIESSDSGPMFKVGKYKGRSVKDVYLEDEDYLEWVYSTTESSFDQGVIESVTDSYKTF